MNVSGVVGTFHVTVCYHVSMVQKSITIVTKNASLKDCLFGLAFRVEINDLPERLGPVEILYV